MVESALDTSEEVAPLSQIERAESELYRVAEEGGNEGKVKSFGEATRLALEQAEKALNSGGHLSGVTTGLDGINAKIGGLHKSDLSILAGRPGMGKTSLATNMAFACAQRFVRDQEDGILPEKSAGAPVAFFSLEMSADQLATRILAEQSGISSENLRMGKISQQEFRHLARAAGELSTLPLYIDDTPGLTIAALRARARRLKRQKGIGFIVVDYLQLLSGSGKGSSGDNRVQEISEISRGLKQLAKELDLPVMALSQLSRAVEQREDKKPMLSDLRESGSIEQDADIVMFVYREDYYVAAKEPKRPMEGDDIKIVEAHEQWMRDMERVYGMAELIVAKQRHGATGKVRMRFDSRITKFSDPIDEGYDARTARLGASSDVPLWRWRACPERSLFRVRTLSTTATSSSAGTSPIRCPCCIGFAAPAPPSAGVNHARRDREPDQRCVRCRCLRLPESRIFRASA